jgi:hypothetical protein
VAHEDNGCLVSPRRNAAFLGGRASLRLHSPITLLPPSKVAGVATATALTGFLLPNNEVSGIRCRGWHSRDAKKGEQLL